VPCPRLEDRRCSQYQRRPWECRQFFCSYASDPNDKIPDWMHPPAIGAMPIHMNRLLVLYIDPRTPELHLDHKARIEEYCKDRGWNAPIFREMKDGLVVSRGTVAGLKDQCKRHGWSEPTFRYEKEAP
jgi:hypothetical protein